MAGETFVTVVIIMLCWIVFLALDAFICGLLAIFTGITFKNAFLWGLFSLALPPVLIAYGALIERNMFKVREICITFEELPDSFDGYRIVHLSDIHARSFERRGKQLKKAVDMVNSLNPDLIAFTGDLITMGPDELDNHEMTLGMLKAADGVISVLGNHDYCIYSDLEAPDKAKQVEKLIQAEKDMGWDLLLDDNRIIRRDNDSIAVIGVQNTSPSRHFPSKGDLRKASEGTEDIFRILLTHDPMHWESEVLGKDYPLTLSGHTHAMQLSLLGWSPSSLIFRQHRGLYAEKGQHLHVNTGLGETIFPARIGVRPEITLITLKAKKRATHG